MILLKVIVQKLAIITTEVKTGLFQQWIEFNVKKAVVKILQGSVVTQTKLGGLTTYSRVANFLQCIHAKNYDNWLAVDKVICKNYQAYFFWPTLYSLATMHSVTVTCPSVCIACLSPSSSLLTQILRGYSSTDLTVLVGICQYCYNGLESCRCPPFIVNTAGVAAGQVRTNIDGFDLQECRGRSMCRTPNNS